MTADIPLEIIAEGGLNHNGNLSTAFRLADGAKVSGADVFKIQTSVPSLEATARAPFAPYQAALGYTSQLAMIEDLMLSRRDTLALAAHCQDIGIEFMSTPGDIESLKFLVEEAGVRRIKIASCDIDNAPLLLAAGGSGLPIILSTGCTVPLDVARALTVLPRRADITLLHCVSAYPAALEDAQVAAMVGLTQFERPIGYSDHTIGPLASAGAVALGAVVIEKHVTLDCDSTGPDHTMSEPMDLFPRFVEMLRGVRVAMGSDVKAPLPCELANRTASRKSLVAACDIHKGDAFTPGNIAVKRPAGGRSPFDYWIVLQNVAARDYRADEFID